MWITAFVIVLLLADCEWLTLAALLAAAWRSTANAQG